MVTAIRAPGRYQWGHEPSLAFGRGSDARLSGISRKENPYHPGTYQYDMWRCGWNHVNQYWGCAVVGRWKIPNLPEVER